MLESTKSIVATIAHEGFKPLAFRLSPLAYPLPGFSISTFAPSFSFLLIAV